MRAIIALTLCLILSGCATMDGGEAGNEGTNSVACDANAAAAFTGAEAYFDSLLEDLDKPFTMVMSGTVEGEVGTMTFSYNPVAKSALMAMDDMEIRIVDGVTMYLDDEDSMLYRDFDPASSARGMLGDGFDDDLGVSFADELSVEDYSVECVKLGGQDALQFTYEEGDLIDRMTMEATAPYRPLAGESVDPALQDNFRISMSYDLPNIQVDQSLPRSPPMILGSLDAYEFEGDYSIEETTFDGDGQWIPVADLDLVIVDAYGDVWDMYEFNAGEYEIDEGIYEFVDEDGNGLVSGGDYITIALESGYDWTLYDSWSDDLVTFEYV